MEINKNLTHPKYRSDIDGLRAIAVLSVVIYHAFPNFLKGGFVGVDIFFVISGFLISTIIFENLNNNSFSFATFYSRRIRRIFPALIIVLITTIIFGFYVLFSDEFQQLGRHIIGGTTFSSNFTLLKESGYFDTASELKPLLHLWSLGIEEQFYIIFPLVCYFLYKYNVRLLLFIIPFTIISFYLNIKGIKTDISKTFYYPHTRFWELLFGSLLAYFTINKSKFISSIGDFLDTIIFQNKVNDNSKQRLLNLISILGFFILVYGLIRINATLKFPGKWALVPVVGAVLIILSGKESIINKFILSNKVLVWFGKISFPLYLWHWVLLAYARIIYGNIPPQSWRITLVIAAIILSYLTYKFIESPLRFGGSNKKKVIFLCVSMLIILGFGWGINHKKISSYNKNNTFQIIYGFNDDFDDWFKGKYNYFIGNQQSKKRILIFGDSHIHQYSKRIKEVFGKDFAIDIFSQPSCYIGKKYKSFYEKNGKVVVIQKNGFNENVVCNNLIKDFSAYLKNYFPDIIITGQRWQGVVENFPTTFSVEELIYDKLDILSEKKFKHLIIVGSSADINFECKKKQLRYITSGLFDFKCDLPQSKNIPQQNFIKETKLLNVKNNIHFIYPYEYFCDTNGNCELISKIGKNNFNYVDDNHLSYYGSIPIVNEIKKIIESK